MGDYEEGGQGALGTVFSASGDTTGVTDSTSLQGLLNAAAPSGGVVLVQPGIYYFSTPIVITPPAAGNIPQPAPSLIGLPSGGHIGDVLFPSERAAIEFRAVTGFPSGKFLIDYAENADGSQWTGGVVSGFTASCNSLAAGLRFVGVRRFDVHNLSIAQTVHATGYADQSDGALSISVKNAFATAGAWNMFRNISILGAGFHGVYHNGPNQDTFLGFNVINCVQSCYYLDAGCIATFTDCSSQQAQTGLFGWTIFGAVATIIGSSTESGGPKNNAVQLLGEANVAANAPQSQTGFIGCQFINNPNNGAAEGSGSIVNCQFTAGRPHATLFDDCDFTANTFTTDWVHVDPSAAGTVAFTNCRFFGTPVTNKINDASGNNILRFRNCQNVNPFGVETPAVPASGTAVAATSHDRTFYVSTVAGTTTMSMAIQGGPTVTFVGAVAQVVAVRVPAGQTVTPTYTGTAPTWVVEGE